MAKIDLTGMNVAQLLELREQVDARLSEHRKELELQLERISPSAARAPRKGQKVAPKYRSKKDASLTWAGRGATPLWMREEMKAGKLKKDAFLIK